MKSNAISDFEKYPKTTGTSPDDCLSRNKLEPTRKRVQKVSTVTLPDSRKRGKRKKMEKSREHRYETADGRIDDVVIL